MSRFFSEKYAALEPYTPGEQPTVMKYVKLNTNESPFPPSQKAVDFAQEYCRKLNLYSELECTDLRNKIAELYQIQPNEVIMTNGSDEILDFAFMAFCDDRTPAAFPEISYGFYPVFAQLNRIPYERIPLKEDYSIDIGDYMNLHKTIFIANPNAPTGMLLSVADIEKIVASNPDNVVVIDEAYIDFGGESCVPLIKKYDNLLVTQTFSKSRSMAGARLGFGMACESLINDLNTIRFSTNPYNVNSMTIAMGVGVLNDEEYTRKNCQTIRDNRAYTVCELEKMNFTVLPSSANFIFAKNNAVSGTILYEKLKERGVLVRHFSGERLEDYLRITIGTKDQMNILLDNLKNILGELS